MSAEDYCDLCDLPLSTCVHGMPPAPPPPPAPVKAPRVRTTTARKAASPATTTRTAPRRWTPPEVLAPAIVATLTEAGGELDQEELFTRLEELMADRLTDADHQTTPEGELRWRYAARKARQTLVAEGVMVKGRPGAWVLA
ncbi:hypothetical protein [Nocardioides caricicola]|uniref:Restriction system protein Mrr-like N-terminal domain-containing protein n=1 Tax=Nocardioides caricicola TaxID=634770 RepID=A0ABW0N0J2_9ACTN